MLQLTEFCERVSELLALDVGSVSPYDGLYDDIGLDSFQAFELIIIVEALADTLVPPPQLPEMYTLADAYAYYQMLAAMP